MVVDDVPDAGTSSAMVTSGKLIETRKDVWDAFGFTESMRKKLPSEHARNSDGRIRESNPGGWSTMVQSVLTAAVKVAEILCPAMSQELVQDATDKVRGAVPARKALMKLENVLIEHNSASPNLTIQKRVTQALLVKGLPKKRMESLQQEGRFHIGGYARMTALADSQAILEGLELIKPTQTRARVEEAVVIEAKISDDFVHNNVDKVRVANQQKAIYKIEEEMKQECLENKTSSKHALVVIDWKMKFESMSARETSQEHFGKQGIAWHGCLLKFFRYEEGSAVRYNIYADQIMEGSNKQDSLAVASMIEAVLYQIHEELSFLEITLQSDNAGCYQSKDLLLAIALISALSPIKTAIAFKVRVFAHSGIGSGIVFDCNIQEQSFAPTQVDQESVLENDNGSDETEDNEDVADNEEGGDYVSAANEEGTELNSSTAVVIGNELVDAAAQIELEADLQDLDVAPKTLPAVKQYMFYGPVNDKSKQMGTGFNVVKCSKLAGLKGPRTLRSQQTEKHMEDFTGVEFSNLHHVWMLWQLLSGKDDMVEYLLSQQLEIPQSSLKRQGWAWRPAHGDTYGTTYVHLYRTEIKEMFDRGVQTETEKMSPAIMLETLQERYPNRYSLPGKNELRTEISSLLQKQKSGRTQKKSKFSTTFTEFIKNIFDQVLEQKDHQLDRIKPKEILAIVKQHLMEEDGSIPLDFSSDKYITAKVSNLKSMAKKEGHRNIMLC
eukprot:Em0020g1105a